LIIAQKRTEHKKRGLVQVYTGNGKGKTTAALGLALRAAGHGLKTYIGQFLKGTDYGELTSVKMLNGLVTIEQYGRRKFVHVGKKPSKTDVRKAREGLEKLRNAMISHKYDIIIADELAIAVHFNLLTLEDVLNLIDERPAHVELIITGRNAPQALIERAELVTEMRELKHPYQKGISARKGIEF
jgi:cob(I)alamin adenosyltransferase